MDAAWLQTTLDDLAFRPAGEVECETLEIKSWCKDERKLSEELAEAAVCLANTLGGHVLVGLEDQAIGRRAVSDCPHRIVTANWIKARLRDLTKPPVQCSVTRVGDIAPSAPPCYRNLFIIEIQKTSRPGGHRTNWGVSYKRSNKECRIEYYEGNDDYSRAVVEHLRYEDLDAAVINSAAAHREITFPSVRSFRPDPMDHLAEFELVHSDTRNTPILTVAAVLLFGSSDSLRSNFPQAESVLMRWDSINKPSTDSRWINVLSAIESHLDWITHHLPKLTAEHFPDEVVRELLLNAYLHRDYRVAAPIHIHMRPEELEIQNPGGLLGALTTDSLIHSPPTYRNFLLADSARQYGYCEKAGTGIDKIFYNLILNGFDFPIFDTSNDSFKALVKFRRDGAFATFIRNWSGDLNLSLTELIVLRSLRSRSKSSTRELARLSQRPVAYMDDVLPDLERRHIVCRSETAWRLSDTTLEQLADCEDEKQLRLFKA